MLSHLCLLNSSINVKELGRWAGTNLTNWLRILPQNQSILFVGLLTTDAIGLIGY